MKNAVFWGVASCRCGRLNRRFGGSYRLNLQGRKIRERRTSFTEKPVVTRWASEAFLYPVYVYLYYYLRFPKHRLHFLLKFYYVFSL
jgi:hypothetical protein